MRDGNFEMFLPAFLTRVVVSLPMRDGNSEGLGFNIDPDLVVSLPMRDGNVCKYGGRKDKVFGC